MFAVDCADEIFVADEADAADTPDATEAEAALADAFACDAARFEAEICVLAAYVAAVDSAAVCAALEETEATSETCPKAPTVSSPENDAFPEELMSVLCPPCCKIGGSILLSNSKDWKLNILFK